MAPRKTVQKETEQKPDTSAWKFIIAFLVVAVLVLGVTLLITKLKADQTVEDNRFNGFDFRESAEGLWVTEVVVRGQPYLIPFYYHPSETLDIFVQPDLADEIVASEIRPDIVYISLDPDAGSRPVVAAVELSRLFGSRYNLMNLPVQSALTRQPDEQVDTPIVKCEDAVNGTLVVLFAEGDISSVVNDGNCVILIYTDPEDSIRVADRFAYEMLKIM
jgi:hypothetical protein